LSLDQVKLSEDDEFIVLACDGIWYDFSLSAFVFICMHLPLVIKVKQILERMPKSNSISSHCIILLP
jgi:serine/threonine protein phosphatase PrpC